jgi:hypothetical protein
MMPTSVCRFAPLDHSLTLISVAAFIPPSHPLPGISDANVDAAEMQGYYEEQEQEMVADQEAGGFEGDLEIGDDDE